MIFLSRKYVILVKFILFWILPCVSFSQVLLPYTNLKFNITVMDENQEMIDGAVVRVNFEYVTQEGIVNTLHENRSSLDAPVSVQERGVRTFTQIAGEGFWDIFLQDGGEDYVNPATGWYFENAVKNLVFMLRRKINPRPLFVHRLHELRIFELETRYGFDFETGDLVRPHGKGTKVDIIFTMHGDVIPETGEYDVRLRISFPNEGDGIQAVPIGEQSGRSVLLLGQNAPTHGYEAGYEIRTIQQRIGRFTRNITTPAHQEQAAFEGMWFRTNTVLDPETGQVLSARYGKIYSDLDYLITFSFFPENHLGMTEGRIGFTYFYAPDHSRSLEFNGETLVPNGNLQGVNKR